MITDLPPLIARFVETSNIRDVDGFVSCFDANAVVEDDGGTHRGLDQVRAWKQKTQDTNRYTIDPVHLETREGETILTATLAGDFPGSPLDLNYAFTTVDDAIVALRIYPAS
jgi:hypothetical protein